MPVYPSNSLCAELGCKNPRSKVNSFCLNHGGMSHTNENSDNAYSNPVWKTIRRVQLSKQPLCQSCLNRGTINSANHIDHVFPWRQIGNEAFLQNIFQSLCHECHSYKTGHERKGIFKYYAADGIKDLSINDYPLMMTAYNRS